MNSPLIRVSRKRTADPHEALILHSKRAKQAGPVVFTLFKAAADGNDEDLEGAQVLDLPANEHVMETPEDENEGSSENPLGFVQDGAVGLVGEVEKQMKKKTEESEQVSLNGRILQPIAAEPQQEDVVFDYYRIHEKRGNSWNSDIDIEAIDVQFANRDELDLGDDDSDGPPPDDEDDSNDEDNWRNDYPDEDSYDENSDGDPYGELVAEEWHGEFPEDNLHRRMQNIAINDRYEAYFEGDDTDDEDGWN